MMHNLTHTVTFGDCDPAGIVFYPNSFRWMDACFHDMLARAGGHAGLCKEIGSVGIGLADASAQFRSPMMDRDALSIRLLGIEWGARALTARYETCVGERLCFTGTEVRCIFKKTDKGISADTTDALRALLEERLNG
ncbi:acyl-CoA thioesterase [Thalassovita sp.]|uniref:acyl-CoA thioesterase n=1 Tax=Thalassovita sp. TaxID=1979401 RepID=UPI003B5B23F8